MEMAEMEIPADISTVVEAGPGAEAGVGAGVGAGAEAAGAPSTVDSAVKC